MDDLPTTHYVKSDDVHIAYQVFGKGVILTGVRSNEAREATWGEIDLAERMWTIPKKRVKMRRDHKVPLSGAAVALLQAIKGADEPDSTALVFKGRWGGPLSEHTGMLAVLQALGCQGNRPRDALVAADMGRRHGARVSTRGRRGVPGSFRGRRGRHL